MVVSAIEIISALLLVAYNLFIILFVSRKICGKFGSYVARKAIHFLSGGVSLVMIPILFKEMYIPILLVGTMILFTLSGHLWKGFGWFQTKGDYSDVYFNVTCVILLAVFWYHNIWIGVLSCLFMAWGDGITGIVRSLVYKERRKGIWGNIAMFTLCTILGYIVLGQIGIIGGAFSSVVEKFDVLNDNISVPLGSAALMAVALLLRL
jgi:phytol kinase